MCKVQNIFQEEMITTKHLHKKHQIFFLFLFGDFNISDIFYKIQILN